MNIFKQVKQTLDIKDVLDHYGVDLKNNKGLCPFHDDNRPSLSVKDNKWHCFACNLGGSIIDFVMLKEGLTPYESALKLSYDFGLNIDIKLERSADSTSCYKQDKDRIKMFEDWKQQAHNKLCRYFKHLNKRMICYAPTSETEKLDNLYIEVINKIGYLEHLLDILAFGTFKEKAWHYRQINKILIEIGADEFDNRTKDKGT